MSRSVDPEADLHVVEFKVRLKPAHARLVRALAEEADVKPNAMLRQWVVARMLSAVHSVPVEPENRRPL